MRALRKNTNLYIFAMDKPSRACSSARQKPPNTSVLGTLLPDWGFCCDDDSEEFEKGTAPRFRVASQPVKKVKKNGTAARKEPTGLTVTDADVVSGGWIGWPSESDSDSDTADQFDRNASSLASASANGEGKHSTSKNNLSCIIEDAAKNKIAKKEKNLLKRAVLESISRPAGETTVSGCNSEKTALSNGHGYSGKFGGTGAISVDNRSDPSTTNSRITEGSYQQQDGASIIFSSRTDSRSKRRFGTPQHVWNGVSDKAAQLRQLGNQSSSSDRNSNDLIHVDDGKQNGNITSGQTRFSQRPSRRESNDCVIVAETHNCQPSRENGRNPQRKPQNVVDLTGSEMSALGSSVYGEDHVEWARNHSMKVDECWSPSPIDCEKDLVGAGTQPPCKLKMDDSNNSLILPDNSELERMQSYPSGRPHRSTASSSSFGSTSGLWDHSLSDFVIEDDEVLHVPCPRHHHEGQSRGRRDVSPTSPGMDFAHFISPGASGGSASTQVPGMPPMTDEEYARFLQEQIDAEECFRVQGEEHGRAHYRPPNDFDPIMLQHFGGHFSPHGGPRMPARPWGRQRRSPPRGFRAQGRRRFSDFYHRFGVEQFLDDSVDGLYALDSSVSSDCVDDYEENLRLQEAIGDVKTKAMPRDLVFQLPTRTYAAADVAAGKECQICMCQYEKGDTERVLPCFHTFHVKCIDTWFEMQATCPVCRESAMPSRTP